jgi:hypothetical protein
VCGWLCGLALALSIRTRGAFRSQTVTLSHRSFSRVPCASPPQASRPFKRNGPPACRNVTMCLHPSPGRLSRGRAVLADVRGYGRPTSRRAVALAGISCTAQVSGSSGKPGESIRSRCVRRFGSCLIESLPQVFSDDVTKFLTEKGLDEALIARFSASLKSPSATCLRINLLRCVRTHKGLA